MSPLERICIQIAIAFILAFQSITHLRLSRIEQSLKAADRPAPSVITSTHQGTASS